MVCTRHAKHHDIACRNFVAPTILHLRKGQFAMRVHKTSRAGPNRPYPPVSSVALHGLRPLQIPNFATLVVFLWLLDVGRDRHGPRYTHRAFAGAVTAQRKLWAKTLSVARGVFSSNVSVKIAQHARDASHPKWRGVFASLRGIIASNRGVFAS